MIAALLIIFAMGGTPEPVTVKWDDGDSGRLYGPGYSEDGTKFRLSGWDAPEISNKAQCEREKRRGAAAKGAAEALTYGAVITVGPETQPPDRWHRIVVPLSVDGEDFAGRMRSIGHVKPWPHDARGEPQANKPDWCH